MNARYKNPDNDSKGPWKLITLHAKSGNNTNFSYTFKNGVTWRPPSGTYPRFSVETMKKYDEEGKIWFGADGKSVPSVKNYLSDVKQGVTPLTIWTYEEVGHNQTAREDVKKCFDGKNPFDTPKPVSLIRQICYVASSSKDCIILDFFSGSSTTAHAVMQLNAEDGGNRKFIMVQLPEPTADNSEAAKAGYKNICEIGKERIRRAGEKIKAECEDKDKAQNLDIGFKVFKLDSSNLKKWNPHPEDLQLSLQESVSNFLPGRSQLDVVYEILLKMGLDLTSPIEERKAGNETVYIIAGGALMICLGEKITLPVAEEIAKLHKEYDSELWQVVFRDTGFASDMDKTNIKETLKTAGLDEDSFVCV